MRNASISITTALAAVCLFASSAVLAKGTGYVFVSSENDDIVKVLDGNTFTTVNDIKTA